MNLQTANNISQKIIQKYFFQLVIHLKLLLLLT